ncbi:IS200/IS605 family accessory protein TnpB-related protein [Oscillatoria salina]|uniref:IS200/IS605 family accessory protein TnpB-related protein n=1 Tax=Oscillatoria salina TaxID=331517 RepID=UPI001CC99DBF|nr:IS200/IS605 family accessory protein TnpB-related protein [Oscillatoria salina]
MVDDYLHQASRYLVNLLMAEEITTLVIGYNPGWKQEIELGSLNNQKFVTIPHRRLIEMITYKCQKEGIKVILLEESYTSVANFLNLDPLPVYGEETEKPIFTGKRIKRGLYKSDRGQLTQADVIGSYNILRKAFPNAFNRYGIERCVVHPLENQSLKVKAKEISAMKFSLSIFDYTFTNYLPHIADEGEGGRQGRQGRQTGNW